VPEWASGSAGFVGVSDGWQQLMARRALPVEYERAENGNVALTGVVSPAADGTFVIALAFGNTAVEAGHRARTSLLGSFESARSTYVAEWQGWQKRLTLSVADDLTDGRLARISAAVLRCHEEKHMPGALIASLSIPWGSTKGDEDLGGYHLVWPRDLAEAAGGLLAIGERDSALRVHD
jgi:glucoamylase